MALLKRIPASTLMETLVATVLIVVIFMISSMLLNNFLSVKIKENADTVKERLHKLEYVFENKEIDVPYYEEFGSWEITIESVEKEGNSLIIFTATNLETKQVITTYVMHEN